MQRARLPYLLIPVAAVLAIIPLLLNGCSCGHDFDFHLISWFEAARQFTHGNLHPHWAYTPAYNAGEPRFVFYPPLSWTTGAILGLLLPQSWGWQWTPILFTWLALVAAGLALYRLARDFTTSTAALVAAVLYMVNPYMLFTAYERTAYAELLAAAWIPLLLHAILRQQVTIPRIAIPVALLWLTNAPAAVMSCYALALLTAVRITTEASNRSLPVASNNRIPTNPGTQYSDFETGASHATNSGAPYLDSEIWASRASATAPAHARITNTSTQTRLQLAINVVLGTALGLGLAAFYILPAAYERRYVEIAMAIIPNMRIQDNFLFHHTGDIPHDQVLHTASLIAVTLIVLTLTALITARATQKARVSHPSMPHREGWDQQPSTGPLLGALAILTLAITLLLTPLTQFIWTHTPELLFLQFPWRLLAILAAVLALAVALALRSMNLQAKVTTILALFLTVALTYPAYATFHQACDLEDTVQSRLTLFHSSQGTDPTDEYTPTTADNDSLAHTNPPYWLSTDPNAKAPTNSQPGPAPTHLTLNAPMAENLILNLRDYPAWRITLNGTPITTRLDRDDGLIALPIPTGSSTIDTTYSHTSDQILGDAISLVSFVLLVFLIRRDYIRFHKP